MYKTRLFSSCQKWFRTSWVQGGRSRSSNWLLAFPWGLCLIGKSPPAVINTIRCRQAWLPVCSPCLWQKTEGEFFLHKVGVWMTVYLWAFLCSRLLFLYYQILPILCLQGDRHDCTYKALMLPSSAVFQRSLKGRSAVLVLLVFVKNYFIFEKLRHVWEEGPDLGCAADQN